MGGPPRVLRRHGQSPAHPGSIRTARVQGVRRRSGRLAVAVRDERHRRGRRVRPGATVPPNAGMRGGCEHRGVRGDSHADPRSSRARAVFLIPRPRVLLRGHRRLHRRLPIITRHRGALRRAGHHDEERRGGTMQGQGSADCRTTVGQTRTSRRRDRVEGVLLRTLRKRQVAVRFVRRAQQMGRVPAQGQGGVHWERVGR